ncbi:iron dependent peroxidase [Actinobacillus ureae]|nr:iron dependent peroxidase [Actinobacillus ureae]SUU44825.1 iron dependent peroxidase [Actinobacillus ureae]
MLHFPRDQLQAEFSGGDICIQACAYDPQVTFHAVRNLVRAVRGEVKMKWSQMGFNSFLNNETPRNLFAFKDGTANAESLKDQDNVVWVQNGWLQGGSYLVVRRIKMFLET